MILLDPFDQRSQYISIKFPLHKQSNQDVLLLVTLQYMKSLKRLIILLFLVQVEQYT